MYGERSEEIASSTCSTSLSNCHSEFNVSRHSLVCHYLLFRCAIFRILPVGSWLCTTICHKKSVSLFSQRTIQPIILHFISGTPQVVIFTQLHQSERLSVCKAYLIFSNTSFLMKIYAHFQINFFPTFLFHRQVTSFKTAFNSSFSVIITIQQVPMINEIFSCLIDYFTNMLIFESKDSKVLAHSRCSIKVESHM